LLRAPPCRDISPRSARPAGSTFSATATARSVRSSTQFCPRRAPTINTTSIKPAVYGDPFVKRHGLFFLIVTPRHGVVSSCVARTHDRSAVHKLDSYRSGRRAGRGDAGVGAGLVDFRSQRGGSHRR